VRFSALRSQLLWEGRVQDPGDRAKWQKRRRLPGDPLGGCHEGGAEMLCQCAVSPRVKLFPQRARVKRAVFRLTGCSAVWLARLFWEQEVPGPNPGTPTPPGSVGMIK
jgi:hypothetical protein